MMTEILDYLKHCKSAGLQEITSALGAPADQVSEALAELTRAGGVVLTKKQKYAVPSGAGLVEARVVVKRNGAFYARPLGGGGDMFLKYRSGQDERPMADDIILVRPEEGGPGSDRCVMAAVTRRAHPEFSAVLTITAARERTGKKQKKGAGRRGRKFVEKPERTISIEPLDRRITAKIELEGSLGGARSGDIVRLKVAGWPARHVPIRVEVKEVLGDAGDMRVQLRALAASHGFNLEFPSDALEAAANMPDVVVESDLAGRMDLRELTAFTIDGEDAQDFDDAVSLETTEDGFKLGVHIADVSHYVRRGTAIDREALARGTSVYLPGLTLPMLPEALSNHICSLMPNVDRLAMSLFMTIKDGEVAQHTLALSVIRSAARLTYHEVNKMLGGQTSDVPEALHETLRSMHQLSLELRNVRHARGAIDFDLAETAFTLGERGIPTDVWARERGESERMIEDFMLLANETVALRAKEAKLPFLYRVHLKPDPDRLKAFEVFLHGLNLNIQVGERPSPKRLQKILDEVADSDEAEVVKQVMLRSLKRAEYAAEPEGHYGLAAKDYCHFTAPIRRYPDLHDHRMLKQMLAGAQKGKKGEKSAPELAHICSLQEQNATLAERDADDLLKAHYMAGHIGEEYSGIVTGVTSWGFYVTLPNTIEGLVHVRTLEGRYELDAAHHRLLSESGGRAVRLGDSARVRVEGVNTAAAEIDFSLVGKPGKVGRG